jgi:hypothetical protein
MECIKCATAVTLGIGRLTEHFGSSAWKRQVNPGILDIRDAEKCVLGQLFGVYERGLSVLWPVRTSLDVRHALAIRYGFQRGPLTCPDGFEHLKEIWIARLTQAA